MADVFDVAKYILKEVGEVSTWKLQKLCYYSQAWTLGWGEPELFSEDFEAWPNGPVCPDLFLKHKGLFNISYDGLKFGNENNLEDCQKENIDIIIRDYGDKEAYWLREQTHGEDPWKNARKGLPEGASSNEVITKDSMGIYYGGL